MDQLFGFLVAIAILLVGLHIGLSMIGFKDTVPKYTKRAIKWIFRTALAIVEGMARWLKNQFH